MGSLCEKLKTKDFQAYSLCEARIDAGDSSTELDVGTARLDFKDPDKPKRVTAGAKDGEISGPEVYQRGIELVFAEEADRAKKYLKNLSKPPAFSPKNHQIFKDKTGGALPFVFDDLNSKTKQDEQLFRLCLKQIKKIKEGLAKKKELKAGSVEYNKALGLALFDFLLESKKDGGLGVQYQRKANRAERDLAGIVAAEEATCLEFVNLFLALARMAELPAVPVEIFRNKKGDLREHVVIAIRLDVADPDNIYFLDISGGFSAAPQGELFTELSTLDLLAYYYNGMNVGSDDKTAREGFLKTALKYSPDQYMVLSNYGHWHLENGGPIERALELFLKACEINPQYPYIFEGLAKVYEQ